MHHIGTHVSSAGGVAQCPLRGREVGVNTIQFFAKNNNQWLAKKPLSDAEIAAYFENRGACGIRTAFSHAGYLINLASTDKKNLALSLKSFRQEMERAVQLELDFVVLHPGAHLGAGVQDAAFRIAENINRGLEPFADLKTVLLLENTAGQGTVVGARFEELAMILDRVERKKSVGVCFDTCHAFAAGYDFRTAQGYAAMWDEFEKTVGLERLKAIHLNDSKRECASRVDRHEHIGRGQIGDAGFRFLMRDSHFEKTPMALETPKLNDPVKYDRENIRRLMGLV